MDGDNVRKEHSPRAKKRIREEGAGEEEAEKKRVQRHSRAKRRPGDGDNQGERSEEGPFGRLVSLNDKFESVQVPATGLLMGRHSACHPLCRFSNNTYISTKHCRLSVVQEGSLRGDSQGRESNDVRSLDGKFPLIRRRHPLHHTVVVEDMSTNGTYINEALIGKGNRGMLTHGDELSLVMSFSNRPDDPTFDLIAYRYER